VSIYLYIMILMTDYLGDGMHREQFGFALALHTLTVVIANFIVAMCRFFLSAIWPRLQGCGNKFTPAAKKYVIEPKKEQTVTNPTTQK
jgi:hypothetical protein